MLSRREKAVTFAGRTGKESSQGITLVEEGYNAKLPDLLDDIGQGNLLYSMGKDDNAQPNLDRPESLDDIVRADNGRFVGLASDF